MLGRGHEGRDRMMEERRQGRGRERDSCIEAETEGKEKSVELESRRHA